MADTQTLGTIGVNASYSRPKKITLTSIGNAGQSNFGGDSSIGSVAGTGGDKVVFENTPELEEQGSTVYIIEDSIRSPGSLIVWMGSPSRRFSINARLISRTVPEAQQNWKNKVLLQAWRMPTTSGGIGTSSAPEVVNLSGYGDNFLAIPCIVQSVSFSYPTDVDYIDAGNANVPIIWPVSVQLLEYHTTDDMSSTYQYDQFKTGQLPGWN